MGSLTHINERISRVYPSLHPAEQQVAEYIRTHLATVGGLTVGELAKTAQVSQPTVIRLTRKLGFDGYREFRRILTNPRSGDDADGSEPLERFHLHPWSTLEDLSPSVSSATKSMLDDLAQALDPAALRRAVRLIADAHTIDIYAEEPTAPSAADLNYKLTCLGLHARVQTNDHLQRIAAAHLTRGDLAMAYSHSGSSPATVDALRLASRAGASTIGITGMPQTPIANWSDALLLVGDGEHEATGGTITSQVAYSALNNMLQIGVMLTDYPRFTARISRSDRAAAEPGNEL